MEFRRRTRNEAERLERELLAPAATLSSRSKGREVPEEPDPYRTAFERDRDRILHSKAFRRLKHKTQVFIDPEGDHFVTRLTHTLQVTQIGRSIATFLSLNETLTEAICLGHDVGHAPFGHAGEEALADYVDAEWLHSQQGLRIFQVLEPINLTWEVLDGIRAHSWKIDPPPGTPEGVVCRFADRIAYLTHDVLDAMRAGVIAEGDLPASAIARFGEPGSPWIAAMIASVIEESIATGEVAMEPDCLEVMHELRDFMFDQVYLRPEAAAHKRRVFTIIHELVDHLLDDPSQIPDTYRNPQSSELGQVIDYVAGMTDRFALRLHDTLFRPEAIG
ncbi:MAG: deoxyguanosinetriphosphate triphosphohydrolase [Acidimicrobiia bacterium]|nr:deoxyguanosinetriphosphate triphosphohydrolase [Acidimicrobiia bacterium]